uniref:Uncharacterized protein n=1 Tax=Acrobeloides nanus TaxID=290746 RepID=A0A914D648_9BILA
MSRWTVAVLVVLYGIIFVEGMRKQGVAVRGKFLCGVSPATANLTKVRIVDVDTGPDPDDTLDEKFVDNTGSFELNGYTRELTNIDPVLYVWHDCNDRSTPCHRKIKIVIPQKFIIGDAPKSEEWVDIGTINLETTFEEEKRECIF